ncbi:MAG: glycosyltransferase family 2 protein [Lachnospiraceae bacterium]
MSVIVPVYNAKKTLNECLDSIMAQDGIEFNVVLVDDGSVDGSSEICDSYAAKYNNVKAIHQENAGVSSARNRGIKEAEGEYITFVDSDDTIEKDYLFELVSAVVQNHSEMAVCGYKLITADNSKDIMMNDKVYRFGDFTTFKELSSKMLLATPWGKVFLKKKILEMFRTDIALGEDVCFVLSYMKEIDSLAIVGKALYCYRVAINKNSLSKKYHDNLFQVVCAVDESKRCLFEKKYPDDIDADIFRIDSLSSDIVLMISKMLKTNICLKEVYKIIEELLNYLKQECDTHEIHNIKLKLIIVCYKCKLLSLLRIVYKIKDM